MSAVDHLAENTRQLLEGLEVERRTESQAVARYSYAMLGALVVGLLSTGPLSQTAFVLAALCAMIANMSLMTRTRLDAHIFTAKASHLYNPEVSGADWLAYHLAERVREEQAAAEASQAADDAIAALNAWIAANPAPLAQGADESVH